MLYHIFTLKKILGMFSEKGWLTVDLLNIPVVFVNQNNMKELKAYHIYEWAFQKYYYDVLTTFQPFLNI